MDHQNETNLGQENNIGADNNLTYDNTDLGSGNTQDLKEQQTDMTTNPLAGGTGQTLETEHDRGFENELPVLPDNFEFPYE